MRSWTMVLGVAMLSATAPRAWGHWVTFDYATWAAEEGGFGAQARDNLRSDDPDAEAVLAEALRRYNVIVEEVDQNAHHGRIYSDMRAVGYTSGIIVAEMEKGLIYTACAAETGDLELLDLAEESFDRAQGLAPRWTDELARAPEFGPTPWTSKFRYRDSKQTRESMWVTIEYVSRAIGETLQLLEDGQIPQPEAFGRIMSLTDLDHIAPYGWRRQAGLDQDLQTAHHAVASLSLNEAILGALHQVFVGREFSEGYVSQRLEDARAAVRQYYEQEAATAEGE